MSYIAVGRSLLAVAMAILFVFYVPALGHPPEAFPIFPGPVL